jgi:uncharacterized YigZ family protein
MRDVFYTIREPARGLYREKGSKFIAVAFPVRSEEEIGEQLAKLRKEYHDARHHCYAWRLGPDMKSYRSNDDGEPSGSAGQPILGQIRSKHLTNVLIVVVRYFGGTLLGVGGLIKAYRSAAADALEQATVIREKVFTRWQLNFGYPQMNAVMRLVKEFDLVMENQQFDMECQLVLAIWKRDEKRVMERIALIGDCRASAVG